MASFKDQVFLISGGARGLGEAQARQLVAEGAKVVIGDVLTAAGQSLARELGAACVFQPLDVTSEAQWAEAVAVAEVAVQQRVRLGGEEPDGRVQRGAARRL